MAQRLSSIRALAGSDKQVNSEPLRVTTLKKRVTLFTCVGGAYLGVKELNHFRTTGWSDVVNRLDKILNSKYCLLMMLRLLPPTPALQMLSSRKFEVMHSSPSTHINPPTSLVGQHLVGATEK